MPFHIFSYCCHVGAEHADLGLTWSQFVGDWLATDMKKHSAKEAPLQLWKI
jgi:hypothetical protein